MPATSHFLLCCGLLAGVMANQAAQAGQTQQQVLVLQLCIAEQASERVEARVTTPLERVLQTLPRLTGMDAVSAHGGASFTLRFEDGPNEQDRKDVEDALARSRAKREMLVLSHSLQLATPRPDGLPASPAGCAVHKGLGGSA